MHPFRSALRPQVLLATTLAIALLPVGAAAARADTGSSDKPVVMGGSDPSNSYLSAVVGGDGRFSEGAYPGGNSTYEIMYGWPGTGTSFTTVDTDGRPAAFGGSDGTFTSAPHEVDGLTNSAVWTAAGISTTQTIRLVTNADTGRTDTAAITYTSRNTDSVSHSVGIRFMNDVDVNDNDGAPFRLPNVGAVTSEQDLRGSAVPDTFQVFSDLADSQHIAAARLSGSGATAPDRLVIGQWPGLTGTLWDYTTTPGMPIISDSAYAAYWNPVTLPPGGTRTVTTYYGLSDVTVDLTPPLALGVSGPATLLKSGDQYSPNPFTVTATVSDVGSAAATAVTAQLNLPLGFHSSSPMSVPLGDVHPGDPERTVSWSVTADPASDPLTISTYSVMVSGTDAPSKTVSRTISRPGLSAYHGPNWVALGDSYSAGEGNPPFIDNNACHRSSAAYSQVLVGTAGFADAAHTVFAACSGATIGNLYPSQGQHGEAGQMEHLNGSTTLVSLTVGGNDVEFANVLGHCLVVRSCENTDGPIVTALIMHTHPRLVALYKDMLAAAPQAKIYVLGYPQFVAPRVSSLSCIGLSSDEAAWMDSEVAMLDSAVQSAVAAVHSTRISYVDTLHLFDGGQACGPTPSFVNQINARHPEYSFHPTAAGQILLASALAHRVRAGR